MGEEPHVVVFFPHFLIEMLGRRVQTVARFDAQRPSLQQCHQKTCWEISSRMCIYDKNMCVCIALLVSLVRWL